MKWFFGKSEKIDDLKNPYGVDNKENNKPVSLLRA